MIIKKHNLILSIMIIFNVLVYVFLSGALLAGEESKMKYTKLTPEEEKVIIHKGTERPFTGKYYNYKANGTYICKRCNAPLYRSENKFDSSCGWPSFDDEIPGAIKRIPDADGMRTEIVCAKCGAHLGHVFLGEKLTSKDVRHCVNSISLNFIPAEQKQTAKTEKAYFAGGCFWGVEYYFQKAKGVIATQVGYMGGDTENPTYEQVCTRETKHAETVEVIFDPSVTDYETLARLFFNIHDPTQVNRQGPDTGDQYRSAIFYGNDAQKNTVLKLVRLLKEKGYKVATEISQASTFWQGESYHQSYYQKNGKQPYCHSYQNRF